MSPSPDTPSALYPDRPIRPLPKRRLRERLSAEVAQAITYPPSTQPNSIFYPTYSLEDDGYSGGGAPPPLDGGTGHEDEGHGHSASVNGVGEEHGRPRSATVPRPPPEILGRARRPALRLGQSKNGIPPPHSAASSVDGYDSFENSNNKKKRKIPTAGELNGGPSAGDIGALYVPTSISLLGSHSEPASADFPHYPNVSSPIAVNKGISGPGRGTFGRPRNARSPLRALPNGQNWSDRNSKTRSSGQWPSLPGDPPGAETLPNTAATAGLPPSARGQENASLLQQYSASTKPNSASTQFTFTCGSQVPGTQWPGTDPLDPGTSRIPKQRGVGAQRSAGNSHMEHHDSNKKSRPKSRRRQEDMELKLQARERKEKARKQYLSGEGPDNGWICYFCDYQAIFGKEPKTLIRRFEKSERDEKLREQERVRKLADAKARGRKGKKKQPAKGGKTKRSRTPSAERDGSSSKRPPDPDETRSQVGDGGHGGLGDGKSQSDGDAPHGGNLNPVDPAGGGVQQAPVTS